MRPIDPTRLGLGSRNDGAVALEFLFLFPLVVAMLYAAASYGIVFFGKYEMQSAVDQAVASALRIDRTRYQQDDLGGQLLGTASTVMTQAIAGLSPRVRESMEAEGVAGCALEASGGLELLRCSMTLNYSESPLVPRMSFGFLGEFPPMPDSLGVEAAVAF